MKKFGDNWSRRPGQVCTIFDLLFRCSLFQSLIDLAILQFGEDVLNSMNWRERDEIGPKLKELFEKVPSLCIYLSGNE